MAYVSVCLPTLNRKRDLARRLAEFREQTLRDFELVVLDDGSTDGTEAMVRDAAREDGRLRYVQLRPPLGMPAVIARCFTEARSEFVAIAHDHDAYRPDAIERLAEALEQAPEAAFAFCGVRTIEPDSGAVLDDSADPGAPQVRTDVAMTFVRTGSSLVGASAVMVRRSRVPDPVVTPGLGLFADVELWCQLALNGPAAYVGASLVDVQGWRRSEALAKLNWTTINRLEKLRLSLVDRVEPRGSRRRRLRYGIRVESARRRGLWLAQLVRHGLDSGETPTRALDGAPLAPCAVAGAARQVGRLRRYLPKSLVRS